MDTHPRPYHLLGRGGQYRWWRPLAEMGLFAVLLGAFALALSALAYGLAAALGISTYDDGAFGDPMFDIIFGFGVVAVALPAVLLAVRWAGMPSSTSTGTTTDACTASLDTCRPPSTKHYTL